MRDTVDNWAGKQDDTLGRPKPSASLLSGAEGEGEGEGEGEIR